MSACKTLSPETLNPKPTLVCMIEDDDRYRALLERWISESADLSVRGSFSNAESALPRLPRLAADVVLLDFALPGIRGAPCIRRILEGAPRTRILVLTGIPGDHVAFEALRAGAQGFSDKEGMTPEKLREEIRSVRAGGHPLSARARALALEAFRAYHAQPAQPQILTRREYEVALLIAEGRTNEQIAAQIGVSPYTVYTHVQNIFVKTNSHTRLEAVFRLWGIRTPRSAHSDVRENTES